MTYLLALETSGRGGSVALARTSAAELCIIDERSLASDQRPAAALHPAIDALLRRHSITPRDLSLIAVTRGPGSFTGLRIGITAAKALAYALRVPVVGISTLDVLAQQAPRTQRTWAILNAQRGEYFVTHYDVGEALPRAHSPYEVLTPAALTERLAPGDVLIGPTASKLAAMASVPCTAIDQSPSASAVAHLAWQRFEHGDTDDLWNLLPDYGRLSYAEEKAQA